MGGPRCPATPCGFPTGSSGSIPPHPVPLLPGEAQYHCLIRAQDPPGRQLWVDFSRPAPASPPLLEPTWPTERKPHTPSTQQAPPWPTAWPEVLPGLPKRLRGQASEMSLETSCSQTPFLWLLHPLSHSPRREPHKHSGQDPFHLSFPGLCYLPGRRRAG